MSIELGVPVKLDRANCDNNPNSQCSRGLHQKSAKYSLNLGDHLLVCLVNPYNVVAIPSYDSTKFRCCEYLPISKAETKNGELVEVTPGTYDLDYSGYNDSLLKSLIEDYNEISNINKNISVEELVNLQEQINDIIKNRTISI
jgi:hypothetical protein